MEERKDCVCNVEARDRQRSRRMDIAVDPSQCDCRLQTLSADWECRAENTNATPKNAIAVTGGETSGMLHLCFQAAENKGAMTGGW